MECKACGAWFGTTKAADLCPTCERALDRLGKYVSRVVWCHECKYSDSCDHTIRIIPGTKTTGWLHGNLHCCTYGVRRADHD